MVRRRQRRPGAKDTQTSKLVLYTTRWSVLRDAQKPIRVKFEVTWYNIVKCQTPLSPISCDASVLSHKARLSATIRITMNKIFPLGTLAGRPLHVMTLLSIFLSSFFQLFSLNQLLSPGTTSHSLPFHKVNLNLRISCSLLSPPPPPLSRLVSSVDTTRYAASCTCDLPICDCAVPAI